MLHKKKVATNVIKMQQQSNDFNINIAAVKSAAQISIKYIPLCFKKKKTDVNKKTQTPTITK